MDWIDIRGNPEKLLELLNEHGARGLAREVGVSHPTVLKWKEKHGIDYDHSQAEYQMLGSTPQKAGEKHGQEEIRPEKEDHGDCWVISSGKRQFKINKEQYKQIRRDYSGENYLTINQICRKYKLPRWKFTLLKNAFGFTHDDVPFTDEEMLNHNPEELAEMQLQRRKDQYFKKLREKEIDNALKELEKYREKEYFVKQIEKAVIGHFQHFIDNYNIPAINQREQQSGELMLEVPIVDLHLSKLAWEPETGNNYDRRIASKLFMGVVDDILRRVEPQEFEKTLFVLGNDYFNFDDMKGDTARGTRQDNDSRWQKMFTTGVELAIRAIDKIRQVAPIEVILVPGNHDWTTSFYAVQYLSAWYKNQDDVAVDTSPKSRKYVRFGNSLIGFTHTDKEKRRIYGCMQVEAKRDWGETIYHEWHGAHLHSEQVKEDLGVTVRKLPSITAKDAWHYERGYQAQARNQAFVWDKRKGLRDIIVTNVRQESVV